MPVSHFIIQKLVVLPLLITCVAAQEAAKKAVQEAAKDVLDGHSHNGHAFNEGPRQVGPLMGTTGNAHLPISSSWDKGQEYFNQGLGQLHGFWYYEAERSFRTILAHDPNCAMAYWGLSQANYENDKRAKAFITEAATLLKKEGLKITPHETAYLQAEIDYHDEKKQKDATKRRKSFLLAYEDIILKYPDDLEAKALLVCRRWQFKRKGIAITSHIGLDAVLEQIFVKKPNHPAHHYAIHLWDSRRHQEALDSAARLGSTAPGIAHMWHMPGHIYSKAKRYQDAVWHQQASARIDHAHMQKWFLLPDQIHNYAHNNEWLSRNFSNLGQIRASIDMTKSLLANPRHPTLNIPTKKGSARYGRSALIKALEKSELWEEALQTANSPWLEKRLKPEDDLSRLRLIAVAQFNLKQKAELNKTIDVINGHLSKAKAEQDQAKKKAVEKATQEKKDAKTVKAAEKKAHDQHQKNIKAFEKTIAELHGYVAAMNGDFKAAIKALSSRPSKPSSLLYQLAYGDHVKTAEAARKQIQKKDKEAIPLAQAIYALYQTKKNDPDIKVGFKELRGISSKIEIDSPVFARLAPIAKELGYPQDWRQPHQAANDIATRPQLDTLGPLHWTPPAAPSFSLPDQHKKPISLTEYRGKPLILVFYLGAGCLHCTEQLTAMADRYSEFKKAGLPILAISTDSVADLKKSQENYEKGDIPFPLVSDFKKKIFKEYTAHDDFENEPLHGTFVIDKKGRVLWSDISADPFMDIDFLIKESKRLLTLHQSP
ncbi:MAG: redoxin domain-containing protein [Akkermansiaceae bacterium]